MATPVKNIWRWPAIFLCLLALRPAQSQPLDALPGYQVIFDDFNYHDLGYPDSTHGLLLFGRNHWFNRAGSSQFTDQAWYYYQWRWQALGRVINPNARITLNTRFPYSIKLSATPGYTRRYDLPNEVPLQIQSGFLYETGTWSINARFDDLENISYFTQAFWLISPVATDRSTVDQAEWSELNFEWQNWFAIDSVPNSSEIDTLLTNDTWAQGNLWVKTLGFEGPAFPQGRLPANQLRTYMANGTHMFGRSIGTAFETGETAGGIPMRNTLLNDAAPFTCYKSNAAGITHISDPLECMRSITRSNAPNHWVQLIIQYDGDDAVFSMYIPEPEEAGHTFMSARVALNERSLPLVTTLGIHTPNQRISLANEEAPVFELDWFYYSPETDLSFADIRRDVATFRELSWERVNLDEAQLSHGELTPWRIEEFNHPSATSRGWSVRPVMRLTNGLEIQWNYRTRGINDSFFSPWSGWQSGGFRFEVPGNPYEVEMDVRVRDHHAMEHSERSFWASKPCMRYNYETQTISDCTGGPQTERRASFDQLPRDLLLDQIYPNPVNNKATIRIGLRYEEPYELAVFDSLGRKQATIASGTLPVGYHLLEWYPKDLAAGQYFLVLRSRNTSRSLPITVIR